MICPNCARSMEVVTIAGVEVDYCREGCQGLFFDNRELERMDQSHEAASDPVLQGILDHERAADTRSHPLVCPRCEIKMRRHGYALGSGIHIDRCYGCNGIWLDRGELSAVRENFKGPEERKRNVEKILSSETELGAQLAAREREMKAEREGADQRRNSAATIGILGRLFGRF